MDSHGLIHHNPRHVSRTRTTQHKPNPLRVHGDLQLVLILNHFPVLPFLRGNVPGWLAAITTWLQRVTIYSTVAKCSGGFYNLIKCRTYNRPVSKVAGLSRPGLVSWLDFIQSVRVDRFPLARRVSTSDKSNQRADYASSPAHSSPRM